MTDTIADYPAYRIYKAREGRKFKHGDQIAIPFETRTHGTLWHFFTLGTVAGYAIQNGEDPEEAIARCKRLMIEDKFGGHKLYWANANAVVIHNGPHTKKEVPGFNFGDKLILQGRVFELKPAPNNNVYLVEV